MLVASVTIIFMKRVMAVCVKTLATLITLTSLVSCSSMVYRQAGSDQFSVPDLTEKGIVIIEGMVELYAVSSSSSGTMLMGFAKMQSGRTQEELYNSNVWEFTTYPGAIIPWYAGEDPHGMHAYQLEPGMYAAVRCVYAAPEADYCPAGYWTLGGRRVGMAFFEVSAGEVINVGQLRVVRTITYNGSSYSVSVVNNHSKAKEYVESNWPSLSDKLQYRPFRFQD